MNRLWRFLGHASFQSASALALAFIADVSILMLFAIGAIWPRPLCLYPLASLAAVSAASLPGTSK